MREIRAMKMRTILRVALCCAVLSATGAANADTWPSRPVKLIVPTGPGAATDIMARLIADDVSRAIGQPMFVENMPGASGILAHETAARAAPDGYTLLFTNTSGMAINLISFKQLPYDPTHDFAAIALVSDPAPQMLSVNAALPVSGLRGQCVPDRLARYHCGEKKGGEKCALLCSYSLSFSFFRPWRKPNPNLHAVIRRVLMIRR